MPNSFQYTAKSQVGSSYELLRPWVTMERSTNSLVRDFGKLGVLDHFAGAVFALQQDVLKAYRVDLSQRENHLLIAAYDRAHPHQLGEFPERFKLALKALPSIDNLNLDYLERPKPVEITDEAHRANVFAARMKSEASRVWLLTTMAMQPTHSSIVLGVKTIWLALQTVDLSEISTEASAFTGFYFNGVKSEPFDKRYWPTDLAFLDGQP